MRVAITGFGIVCAVGDSVASAWPRILAGDRGIGPISLFDVTGQRASIAAEVKGIQLPPHDRDGSPWSRTDAMALQAAREALAHAGIDPGNTRLGFVVGGTTGGMFETEALLARMHEDPAQRVPNKEMLAHPLSATGDRLGALLGPFARARTVCSACSSGANAFAIGASWLALDLVDAVLVGGTDALCRLTFTGFNALGAIDPTPARPFDARRRGLSIGEGAGFALLERPERAAARGAKHDVELVGVGITSEGHHITNPAEDGVHPARAIEAALREAGVTPRDVDYVNAHGTATPLNDAMETRAIARALGDDVKRTWVSSTKASIGHTLGAAGAIEAVIASLAVRDGKLPPTAGLEEIDEKCSALRHVPREGTGAEVRVALSNAFGFGGVDTVLAFARAGYVTEKKAAKRVVFVTGIGSASRAGALRGIENASLVCASLGTPVDPVGKLDPARARRLDRAARLATVATELAGASGDDGVVLGTSYGDADGSAAFLAKLFDKGPRLVPPADFPNLVPSSPSGHVSIYLGLHGPAVAIADLVTSGEAAIATAYEWIATGTSNALAAGSIEGPSEIVANCLAPVFRALEGVKTTTNDRTEGSAIVRLSNEDRDGTGVRIVDVAQGIDGDAVLARAPAPEGRAIVVAGELGAAARASLARSAWSNAEAQHEVVGTVGRHEGIGGFAVAAAAALLLRGAADCALVLGVSPGRSYAIVLRR